MALIWRDRGVIVSLDTVCCSVEPSLLLTVHAQFFQQLTKAKAQ